jgi:Ca2+-binding EF-hand superfamily protein
LEQLGDSFKEVLNIYKKELDPSAKINYNGNPTLFPEFIASTMDMKSRLVGEDNLRAVFAMFDKDGDGKITANELKQLLGTSEQFKNKPEKFWDDMIKEVDLNGDGEVCFFLTRLTTKSSRQ